VSVANFLKKTSSLLAKSGPFSLTMMMLIGGSTLMATLYLKIQKINSPQTAFISGTGALVFAISSILLSVIFIKGDRESGAANEELLKFRINLAEKRGSRNLSDATLIRILSKRLSDLEHSVQQFESIERLNNDQISQDVFDKVADMMSDEVIERAAQKVRSSVSEFVSAESVRDAFSDTTVRLEIDIDKLRSSGTYNLAIGGVVSLVGIFMLSYFLFAEGRSASSSDMTSFVIHFLPRIALVILVEGFALFFLKMYKYSIEAIRYVQNEITNVEQRRVAYEIAIGCKDAKGLHSIIAGASSVERNFILKKGESTIDLEKMKLDSVGNASDVIKSVVPDIIKALK